MPRVPTSNPNSELAVAMFRQLLDERRWPLQDAWLGIVSLLMTCETWVDGRWVPVGSPPALVIMERSSYKLTKSGQENATFGQARSVGHELARRLGVDVSELCGAIGIYFRNPAIASLQPNNPRGHAFRSLVSAMLDIFGDPALKIEEEVSPHDLFPGHEFSTRSESAKIDIVVSRGTKIVALATTRWTYRHDRVDILEEADSYMPAARRANPDCRFFGVTCEFMEARLEKVVKATAPARRNASVERLVHVCPELATDVLGRNGVLTNLWSLQELVLDSFNWR